MTNTIAVLRFGDGTALLTDESLLGCDVSALNQPSVYTPSVRQ